MASWPDTHVCRPSATRTMCRVTARREQPSVADAGRRARQSHPFPARACPRGRLAPRLGGAVGVRRGGGRMRGTGQMVTLHDVAIWSENAWVTIGLRRPSAAHTECCVGTTHGRGGPATANGRGRPSSSSRLRRNPQLAPEALEMPFPLLPAWLAHAERLRPLAGGGRGVRRRRAPRYQIVARAQRTLLRRWCRTGSVSGRGETGHGTCHPAHEPAGGRSSPHEEEEASSACAREALETLPPPKPLRGWPTQDVYATLAGGSQRVYAL